VVLGYLLSNKPKNIQSRLTMGWSIYNREISAVVHPSSSPTFHKNTVAWRCVAGLPGSQPWLAGTSTKLNGRIIEVNGGFSINGVKTMS